MKKNTVKKSVRKLVLAGLVIVILPTYLFSYQFDTKRPKKASSTQKKTPTPQKIVPSHTKPITKKISPLKPRPTPITPKNTTLKRFFTNWEQKKPTTAEINNAINYVKDVRKRIQKMISIITGITVGVTVAGIALGVAVSIISLTISALFPPAAPVGVLIAEYGPIKVFEESAKAASATVLSQAAPGIVAGLIIAVISGTTFPFAGILSAGLTATRLLDSVTLAKALKKIEQRYPGTLTMNQITEVEKFHKIAFKGTVSKGIVKGIRLKNALGSSVKNALIKNPQIIALLGAEKAFPRAKKYIKSSRQLENLESTIDDYKKRAAKYKKIMAENKPFTKAHAQATFKLLSINTSLKYSYIKKQASKLRARIYKFNRKYRGINKMLAGAIKTYKTQANAILEDFRSVIDKIAIESEVALDKSVQQVVANIKNNPILVNKIGKNKLFKIVNKLIKRQKEVVDLNKLINTHNKAKKAWSFNYQAKVNRRNKLVKKLKRDNKKYPGLFNCLKEPTKEYIKDTMAIEEKFKKTF